MKEQMKKITSNPVGAIAGGLVVFYGAKKMGKVSNMYALAGLTLVGVIAGAMIQAKIGAKKSVPTAATVTK